MWRLKKSVWSLWGGSNPMEENFMCQFTWLGIKLGKQAKICGGQILYFFSFVLGAQVWAPIKG
ncbi:hypothetical protein R3W88_008156 [Solanum pinnatisectum]|uniref:Uncharacterized protein n=1 Tax=Solanum pinnatisectum TaxID=50273 RepID=A0AAV9MAJ2_9SOLN|nr:hypothetical protein R3W88_008156 [Solanum pinnatisectum]